MPLNWDANGGGINMDGTLSDSCCFFATGVVTLCRISTFVLARHVANTLHACVDGTVVM